jgi:hypothetical protein
MSASWFCVRTRPDAEERVYLGILGSGVEAFMPIGLMGAIYRTTRRRDSVVTWQPVFRNHLFARIDPATDLPQVLEPPASTASYGGAGSRMSNPIRRQPAPALI